MRTSPRWAFGLSFAILAAVAAIASSAPSLKAQQPANLPSAAQAPTAEVVIPGGLTPQRSAGDLAAFQQKWLDRREAIAAANGVALAGPPDAAMPPSRARQTGVQPLNVDLNAGLTAAASDLVFGRNNTYTVAGYGTSVTAEPAAANDGPLVFYT